MCMCASRSVNYTVLLGISMKVMIRMQNPIILIRIDVLPQLAYLFCLFGIVFWVFLMPVVKCVNGYGIRSYTTLSIAAEGVKDVFSVSQRFGLVFHAVINPSLRLGELLEFSRYSFCTNSGNKRKARH